MLQTDGNGQLRLSVDVAGRDRRGRVKIVDISNAAHLLRDGLTSLIIVDTWQHAYWTNYRNARPEYLEELWDIVNWAFFASNCD